LPRKTFPQRTNSILSTTFQGHANIQEALMPQKFAFTTAAMAAALEETPVSYEDLADIEKDFDDAETDISEYTPAPQRDAIISDQSTPLSRLDPPTFRISTTHRDNNPLSQQPEL
jgi:hypothetical protein